MVNTVSVKSMDERISKLKQALFPEVRPICVEKALLTMESFIQTESDSQIIRNAKAIAHVLDKSTIFIEDNELIVGNAASKPMGAEIQPFTGEWFTDEIEAVRADGYSISDEDKEKVKVINDFFRGKHVPDMMRHIYDTFDKRLWPYLEAGITLPVWSKERGPGGGWAVGGIGMSVIQALVIIDFGKILNEGVKPIIEKAKQELGKIQFTSANAIERANYMRAVIIAYEAFIRYANRFAALAQEEAAKETDPVRKNELLKIASTCRNVPENPARDFREAIQSFWFMFLITRPAGWSLGRFDQFMYPFYKKDKEQGKITDEEVIELLECLRIKDMQTNAFNSAKGYREKWAGMAKWHNMVIGGQTPDGKDATNELTYLVLEAVMRCRTPHHTVTLRVHEKTPEALMLKALEVVRTGIGMPAFIGDKSYIAFLMSRGVPLELAREYAISGCVDPEIPAQSYTIAAYTCLTTVIFDIFMHNGVHPRTGKLLGPRTGEPEDFKSFEEVITAYKKQLNYFLEIVAEANNVYSFVTREKVPDPIISPLMIDGIKEGKDYLNRKLVYDAMAAIIAVGMINVADSMAVIKKLVFDDKKLTMKELKQALDADWKGYEEIRKMCLQAPKFGNGDDYVDLIAQDLYKFFAEKTSTLDNIHGGKHLPCAISASNQWPAGALTGATPDGRFCGECLADGTMSAMRGRDTHGPTALIKSALKVNQNAYEDTLMNMKFHPSALNTTEDLKKVSVLIRTYLNSGGKHIQFNVVNKDMLEDAQKHPENHRDLIVRVAGYSAYFVQLGKDIQNEIIGRTAYKSA